jgi:glycosyltransferase involved in cell wall biosynthesis
MSDTQERDARRRWLTEKLKRMILAECDAAVVAGERHADYLERLGFDRHRIALKYDAVDNDHFARGAAIARRRGAELRRALGLPDRYLLCSGRFIPKKNLEALLRGYDEYRRRGGALDLVLLGDGPLRQRLLRVRHDAGLDRHVHLPGFKQYDELPVFYGLATAFILPSTTEQWGLVVNEAMASGLPVLVSRACGAAELVREGENGHVFDPERAGDIARAIEWLPEDDSRLAQMGQASVRVIAEVSPAAFAASVARAIDIGDTHRRRRTRRLLPNPALWV